MMCQNWQDQNLKRTESPNPNIALLIWSIISPNLYHSVHMFVFHFTSTNHLYRWRNPSISKGTSKPSPWHPMGLTTGGVRFSGGFSGTGQRNRSPSQLDAATQSSLDFFFSNGTMVGDPKKRQKSSITWNVPIQGAYWSNSSASALGTVHLVKKPHHVLSVFGWRRNRII